jgi:hypothetical protein
MADARIPCPVCQRDCPVDDDGNSGFCETEQVPWTKQTVVPPNLGRDPIKHADILEYFLAPVRWSFRVTGRYFFPTLEQWELGFMRATDAEVLIVRWLRLSFAFISWHRRRGLPLRDEQQERHLVFELYRVAEGDNTVDDDIAACWRFPDGWLEEMNRLYHAMDLAERAPLWTAPPAVADWPVE